MSAIFFTYNQRVGSKKLAVTECEENPLKCYTWSINETKPVRKDGVQFIYYRCTGCYGMRVKWKKQDVPLEDFPLPMMKADRVKCVWIDDDNFEEHLTSFLLNIGYLMGYNNRPGEIVDGEIGADPAVEDAINNEEEARIAVENIEFNLY